MLQPSETVLISYLFHLNNNYIRMILKAPAVFAALLNRFEFNMGFTCIALSAGLLLRQLTIAMTLLTETGKR